MLLLLSKSQLNTFKAWVYCLFEPRHDKTNEVSVCPVKTQISLGICPVWSKSSLSAWRKLESLATHWVHSEDWWDWADAQADPSLRWVHTHFVGFVMSRLIYIVYHFPFSHLNVFLHCQLKALQKWATAWQNQQNDLCVQQSRCIHQVW